ncbi:MAG TPA: alpha/beta hydrolase [Flavobacterium sp.]|uniref:alpha/beta fold hydrolase n=1 Tax=Flavobacterium sp. TaxID=239 RepID=UPI002B882DAC|nr:alpha/beta hydrolase [Flavobacterium sp.]HSD15362.1 alpha/beta hydrolase [Flavobacterium sp.]
MQPLLLLHGALGSQTQFENLKMKLSTNYKVYSLDFTGHGSSPLTDGEPLSIASFTQQVLVFLKEHQLTNVAIFGYSMGGYVALYLAKHHPDRVGKIFTLATKFDWNPESSKKEAAMLNWEIMEQKVPKFTQYLQGLHQVDKAPRLVKETAQMMLAMGEEPPLTVDEVGGLEQPILFSVGDKDVMVSFDETLALYKSKSNNQLWVVPDTVHAFEKVNLDRLSSEIECFFN